MISGVVPPWDIIYSQPGLLRVYQRLPSPPRLSILNATTAGIKLLSWEHLFTMKITELNIIRYRVCFSFTDINVLEQCIFTQHDSYSYPNIHLTLIFFVTVINMFGYGEKSEITHFPCTSSTYLPGVGYNILVILVHICCIYMFRYCS